MLPATNGRFGLGRTVATPGVLEALAESSEHLAHFVRRHQACDWGEVGTEDWQANDLALTTGELLSVYRPSTGTKIWIITEADRSATTVLLPDDY